MYYSYKFTWLNMEKLIKQLEENTKTIAVLTYKKELLEKIIKVSYLEFPRGLSMRGKIIDLILEG